MLLLYSIGIRLYGLFISLASIIHPKAKSWKQGRKSQVNRIQNKIREWKNSPVIIVHAASYGEYEMAKPIIEKMQSLIQDLKIIVSFFSPSGYENVKLVKANQYKIYLPLDTIKHQEELINAINPLAVIFIKYEYWYNLLKVLIEKKIPYYYTSMNLNSDAYQFSIIGRPFKKLIAQSRLILALNEDSKRILNDQNINNVKVMGDTRINKALENKKMESEEIKFSNENPVIIIGSLTPEDIKMVTDYINKNDQYNYIIAPHDIDELSIKKITQHLQGPYINYTDKKISNILILNTLGDLKKIYRFGDIAYIGGGFSKGPHNLIEPLVYGLKVCCGANIKKFPMAQYLSRESLVQLIHSQQDFDKTITDLLTIDEQLHQQKCETFIQANQSNIDLLTQDIELLIS
jgi:3-deoxy-D-manno-octulosonic-acid transferase